MRADMCLLLIAYRQHPRYPLLLLANRDEFYRRPTAPAQPWEDGNVVAGRDLEAGGTWLGIAPGGRVAAVTNMREPGAPEPADLLSRGEIPIGFLTGNTNPTSYAHALPGARYRGFNALLFDPRAEPPLVCAGNRHHPFAMTPGLHGISNGAPDDPWPKVTRGCNALAALVQNLPETLDSENFAAPALALLADTKRAPPSQLPETGVSAAMESALSSIFVRITAQELARDRPSMVDGYGTRASTLVAVDSDGGVQLWEQGFADGLVSGALRHFYLPSARSTSP
ncbi:NRDE family protein [Microbulbifer sp. SH-1]|uniref:NRDE family protein n=1 Tax=Microbulbifer sp. SH-1 TaxID=2681547 RepID=UPI001F0ED50E|nr:NRDE family protein [Microbulbifer sp. SH-1]